MRLRPIAGIVLAGALVALLTVPFSTAAVAEDEKCATYDLGSIFDEEYYEGVKWDNTKGLKVIKWSPDSPTLDGNPVSRPFTAEELGYLQESFDAWDLALDTVDFKRVSNPAEADILMVLTGIQNNGFWRVKLDGGFRVSGDITISTTTPIFLTPAGFKTIALSEIGNILGLGDIQHPVGFHSVLEDPDNPPFGVIPLEDEDIDMMRQFYGESTCRSTWSEALKKAKADAKARAEASASPTPSVTVTATPTATPSPSQPPVATKTPAKVVLKTITCVKGKAIKKVVAAKPVCPRGFKKK